MLVVGVSLSIGGFDQRVVELENSWGSFQRLSVRFRIFSFVQNIYTFTRFEKQVKLWK